MNFFLLLFFVLLSLQLSTVQSPVEGATEAIFQLFMAANLRLCEDEFLGGATSVFETAESQCKVFFIPSDEFIVEPSTKDDEVERILPIQLKQFKSYFVKVGKKFDVVSVSAKPWRAGLKKLEDPSVSFYCAKPSEACKKVGKHGKGGKLRWTLSNWKNWTIYKFAGSVFLSDEEDRLKSELFCPILALQYAMPHMKKAGRQWRPETVRFDSQSNQLYIKSENKEPLFGQSFSVQLSPVNFIPSQYLEAVASSYKAMGVAKYLDYMPQRARKLETPASPMSKRKRTTSQ